MNGTGESGFYSVDGFPTVYRRNYLKISVGFQLSCGAKQKEMVFIDPVSGAQKKVTCLQAIATSLDRAETLKQYGPKRDKGDVYLLQRQFTIPQDLHNSRVCYHRIQFKTAGKGGTNNGSSYSHKMAITKAQIRFELYAQFEKNEPEILVSSLSSQVLALRGRSQKYYDNLDDSLKRQVLQMLHSPFRPRQPGMSSSCLSTTATTTTPLITESLFGEFQRSPMFNPNLFQTTSSTSHGYSGSFDSATGFGEGIEYLDSPAGSIMSPLDSLLSPTSTTMAFSPCSFDLTFANGASASSPFYNDSFQFQPLGGASGPPFLPKQQQQQQQQQQRVPGLSQQEEFNPLEVSPDCVLNDFFKGETLHAASMPFFGSSAATTVPAATATATTIISNQNQNQQQQYGMTFSSEFPTPASTSASNGGAPSPSPGSGPFGVFSRRPASAPMANKHHHHHHHHHMSYTAKSRLKIDTTRGMASSLVGIGNNGNIGNNANASQQQPQQAYSPYLRFKSPLSAQMPMTAFDFGSELDRVQSAPPLDVGFEKGGFW